MVFKCVPYCYNLYGVGQASKYYFGKPAQDLNLSEASYWSH